jgi:hypothetical protein
MIEDSRELLHPSQNAAYCRTRNVFLARAEYHTAEPLRLS